MIMRACSLAPSPSFPTQEPGLRPHESPSRQMLPALPYLLGGGSRRRSTSSIPGVVHPCSRPACGRRWPGGPDEGRDRPFPGPTTSMWIGRSLPPGIGVYTSAGEGWGEGIKRPWLTQLPLIPSFSPRGRRGIYFRCAGDLCGYLCPLGAEGEPWRAAHALLKTEILGSLK